MILLNFTGTPIKGTSTVDAHKDWITISGTNLSVCRAISSSGGGDRDTRNPMISEVSLAKATDLASPDLFMQAVCGKSLGDAEIHFIHTGGSDKKQQVYLKVVLGGAIVSSYSLTSNGDRPTDTFSISFTTISYTFDAFSGDTVTSGTPKKWDLEKNQKI
ncbi:hypothetical protein PspS35_17850 [Pseudomonas sp. S35]|uniref:type VI secretion system tube protein Hcp n=1 Tax=Pseudomonas sp. S35 TaxID=1573719 RepID=UPI00132F1284|nr:type VI secretion system tube protein Hcp [Pseudomonas sp. S35]QHF45564.1 hypothetical protein PspS35_17850 [Pseudomonas sp. S35]